MLICDTMSFLSRHYTGSQRRSRYSVYNTGPDRGSSWKGTMSGGEGDFLLAPNPPREMKIPRGIGLSWKRIPPGLEIENSC